VDVSEQVNPNTVFMCRSTEVHLCVRRSDRSFEVNDLLGGQSDELVEVKLDVFPPVTSVLAVCLSRITRTACNTD